MIAMRWPQPDARTVGQPQTPPSTGNGVIELLICLSLRVHNGSDTFVRCSERGSSTLRRTHLRGAGAHELRKLREARRRGMAERGENSEFTRLVLPHLADALTIATWLTGSRADAEDVVQEACLRALRA